MHSRIGQQGPPHPTVGTACPWHQPGTPSDSSERPQPDGCGRSRVATARARLSGEEPPLAPTTAPTSALAAQLEGPSPWYGIEHLEEVTSTNDVASRRAGEGAAAGLVVVADRQTAGRGRQGRRWVDPGTPGASLLASFLSGVPQRNLSLVPLAAGLATSDAIRRQGVRTELKWPNDVLIAADEPGGLDKLAGVLVEHHAGGEGVPAHLVVGVGIDVDWRGQDRPEEGWTSIAEHTGADVDRWEVLGDLMRALAVWLRDVPTDHGRLLGAYISRCGSVGRGVSVDTPGGEIRGRVRTVAPSGALVVETAEGPVEVTVGDVTDL